MTASRSPSQSSKSGERWRFDTAAGREELLARRIGANELDTIKVLQAIVDAEREYATQDRNGDGVFSYAQKFESAPAGTTVSIGRRKRAKRRARLVL
jgi:hypothetical protein